MSCESSFVKWGFFTDKMPFSSQRSQQETGVRFKVTAVLPAALGSESRQIPLRGLVQFPIFRVPEYSESRWRSGSVLGSVWVELGILKQWLERLLAYRRHLTWRIREHGGAFP